jgi:hypothetical protein
VNSCGVFFTKDTYLPTYFLGLHKTPNKFSMLHTVSLTTLALKSASIGTYLNYRGAGTQKIAETLSDSTYF